MESDKIEKLLDKYFEATTTVTEEESLRNYFNKEDVPIQLRPYVPMFKYISNAKEEHYSKQIMLPKKTGAMRTYYKWLSVAAVAVLIFGLYFGRAYQEQREAEYAYNQTIKALTLLAVNLERGTEKVAYLKEFEATKEKIYNNE